MAELTHVAVDVAAKTTLVEIFRLKLGKDDVLVIRPEGFNAMQCREVAEMLANTAKYTKNRQLRRVLDRTLVFPSSFDLEVVTAEPAGVSV